MNLWPFGKKGRKDQGIKPFIEGESLSEFLKPIEPQEQLQLFHREIERLQVAWSDEKTWNRLIVPTLENLSRVVQRLPVTSNSVFSEPYGLFLASLQSATFAVEVMEGTVQLDRNIMAQELLQTRLKGAALLASLCAFVKVLVNELEIRHDELKNHPFFEMDEAHYVDNLAFNALAMPYFDWVKEKLHQNPGLKLDLIWRAPRMRPLNEKRMSLSLFVARMIIPSNTMAWLGQAGQLPLLELMKALTSNQDVRFDPTSVIYARDLGVYRACQLEREKLGAKFGRMLQPYGWQEVLIRILRARIWQDWTINAKDSPLRQGSDGLFLFWPDVCEILLKDLENQGLKDLPTDPQLWAGLLLEAGITLPSQRNTATVMIAVTPNAKPREAIKLADEDYFSWGSQKIKKGKRAFECQHLNLAQEAGISRLTRQVLEQAQRAFSDSLPLSVSEIFTIIWRWENECRHEALKEKLEALADFLTSLGQEVEDFLVDEGVLLTKGLLGRAGCIADPSLFIAELESEGFLHRDEQGNLLFASYPDVSAKVDQAPILLPSLLTIYREKEGERVILSFDQVFEVLKKRKRHSKKMEEEAYQLELFKGTSL